MNGNQKWIPKSVKENKEVKKRVVTIQRIAITHAGRIARNIIRQIVEEKNPNIKISALGGNFKETDSFKKKSIQAQIIARALNCDSIYGRWQGFNAKAMFRHDKVIILINNEYEIEILGQNENESYSWEKLQIDGVIETRNIKTADLEKHEEEKVKYIIVNNNLPTGENNLETFCYGINHKNISSETKRLENISSTSAMLLSVAKMLDNFKIEAISSTTTIPKTSLQRKHCLECCLNIVNQNIDISSEIKKINPELASKTSFNFFHVPTANVAIDTITIKLKEDITREQILEACSKNDSVKIKNTKVSGLELGETASAILVEDSIKVEKTENNETFIRMQVWHDDEASQAFRIIKTIEEITISLEQQKKGNTNKNKDVQNKISLPTKTVKNFGGYNQSLEEKKVEKQLTIAINGAGRVAMSAIRQLVGDERFNLVAIAYYDIDSLVDRLQWDTAHGKLNATIEKLENYIKINGKRIDIVEIAKDADDLKNLPWKKYNIDILLDTTGVFKTYGELEGHIKAGAKRVILSAPFKDKDDKIQKFSIVPGVNTEKCFGSNIFSSASCTTNGLTPPLKVINDKFKIDYAHFVTTHAVTASQNLIDQRSKKSERGRSSKNTILTTTGAAKATGYVIPEISGRVTGDSLRVDTVNGSVISVNILAKSKVTADEVNSALYEASKNELKGILKLSDTIISTKEIISEENTSVVSAQSTRTIELPDNKTLIKLIIFYDNEYGYANQMLRLAEIVGSKI